MRNIYSNPLTNRYASKEMSYIFSDEFKFKTWRKLWITLAKGEKSLGLNITDEQIKELESFKDDINFEVALEREKIVKHDVMSHVYAYGVQCPNAKGIIHLGATSCFVGDNTELIVMKEALLVVKKKIINVLNLLKTNALKYKKIPTLAYTHFQPAQPTTVGKRLTLYMQDLLIDLEELNFILENLKLRGAKGTTGSQASFMELFDNDEEKVKKLDNFIAQEMNFKGVFAVSSQTYTRKIDSKILFLLSNIAQSAHKFSNDLRLLQHLKEIEEPFGKNQIGSSAMPYKRNPMKSERIGALSNFVISNVINPSITFATQWFERTLDDSANKRLSISQGFLAIDGILELYANVVDGMVVYEKVIEKHLMAELPFMASENIMMNQVKKGGDRQELHERIRELSQIAGKNVKEKGLENNLLELIKDDEFFDINEDELEEVLDPSKYIGRCPSQVDEFIENEVNPVLENNKNLIEEIKEIEI